MPGLLQHTRTHLAYRKRKEMKINWSVREGSWRWNALCQPLHHTSECILHAIIAKFNLKILNLPPERSFKQMRKGWKLIELKSGKVQGGHYSMPHCNCTELLTPGNVFVQSLLLCIINIVHCEFFQPFLSKFFCQCFLLFSTFDKLGSSTIHCNLWKLRIYFRIGFYKYRYENEKYWCTIVAEISNFNWTPHLPQLRIYFRIS